MKMTHRLDKAKKELLAYTDKLSEGIDSDNAKIVKLQAQNSTLRGQLESIFNSFKEVSWSEITAGIQTGVENPDNFFGRHLKLTNQTKASSSIFRPTSPRSRSTLRT